ncbi:LysR family transcriptional regulator [Nitrospirillum sp. BR 11164]|uniref:LysR family transcriptional regulator n=1 Tax=Nitrospirillum sp. BR 11164 TaxID=3104324 RepID=UPI002AFEA2FF|nr:LysR family transcriptional regulator [Nitrospirillum sp. BR 11164]MEA1650643.1 LysR family transcriptional regulator [Nitrospirillum sp. BR 11164]
MKIHQLKAFVAVADSHSFNEAARLLSVSQPAVAKTIRELEIWAGRQLVIRSSRGTQLTPDGVSLLRRARGILDQVARAELEFTGSGPHEHVSLGLTTSASVAVTSTLVDFKKRNPDTGWTVLGGSRRPLFEKLYNHTLDLVIATLPDNLEEMGTGLRFEPLLRLPTVLTVAKGDPLEKARSLADLTQAEWLFAESEQSFDHHFRNAFAEAGVDRLPSFTRCESTFLVLALAARPNTVTMWTGLAPNAMKLQLKVLGENITPLALKEKLPDITVCVVYRSDLIMTPAIQRLLDQVRRLKDKDTLDLGPNAPMLSLG